MDGRRREARVARLRKWRLRLGPGYPGRRSQTRLPWATIGHPCGVLIQRLRRITARVRWGGHHVARTDVLRRFDRGWKNFENFYKPLANSWELYDNSEEEFQLIEIKQ